MGQHISFLIYKDFMSCMDLSWHMAVKRVRGRTKLHAIVFKLWSVWYGGGKRLKFELNGKSKKRKFVS